MREYFSNCDKWGVTRKNNLQLGALDEEGKELLVNLIIDEGPLDGRWWVESAV